VLQCVAVCCSVVQCRAVSCSVLQCLAVCDSHLFRKVPPGGAREKRAHMCVSTFLLYFTFQRCR